MSRVGGYVLDLYCDNNYCIQKGEQFQFVAHTLGRAVRQARREGWITSEKRDLCPSCAPIARQIPMPNREEVW